MTDVERLRQLAVIADVSIHLLAHDEVHAALCVAADEIERLRVEARDQRFVIEALNASVDRMERDLAWWRERERARLAAIVGETDD
jgi:hypothetical protein